MMKQLAPPRPNYYDKLWPALSSFAADLLAIPSFEQEWIPRPPHWRTYRSLSVCFYMKHLQPLTTIVAELRAAGTSLSRSMVPRVTETHNHAAFPNLFTGFGLKDTQGRLPAGAWESLVGDLGPLVFITKAMKGAIKEISLQLASRILRRCARASPSLFVVC